MKHVSKLLAIAAFALTASSFSNQAHAEMGVQLDNFANGGSIAWAPSNNQVSVCVRFFSVFNPICSSLGSLVPSGAPTNHKFLWNGIETVNDAKRIEARINGADMFWIDQIELLNAQGQVAWRSGVDNTTGWCLSTQPGAGNATYCSPTNASPMKFWDK